MRSKVAIPTLLAAISLASLTAHAQVERSGDANARVMQQLQQLSGERMQLKSENDKLKSEVEDLKKQLSGTTSGQSSLQQRLKTAEANAAREAVSSQQNAESLEKMRAQMQELITRFRETAQSLKEVEADRADIRAKLQTRDREFSKCVDNNVGLYDLNKEILDRYEHKGVWNALSGKEPFTGLAKTRLENLIDDYKYRADDLHLEQARQSAK